MTARPTLTRLKRTPIRIGITFLMGAVCIGVFWHQINDLNFDEVRLLFSQISFGQWALAALATVGSFAALGHYDALWHHALKTGASPQRAHRTGMCAVAIGQTIGLAAVTGSVVRWRRFPELAASQIVALSAAVSVSFLICWVFLAVPSVWYIMGTHSSVMPPFWVLWVLVAVIFFVGSRLCVRYDISRKIAAHLLAWSIVDLCCAAFVVYAFLPADITVGHVIAAVIIATGAGLLSNAPGGLGAFDVTLVALLPMVPLESLVSALLAYRVVYILIPFTVAAIVLSRRQMPLSKPDDADPSAWGVARQSGGIVHGPGWRALMGETMIGPVAIGDPVARDVSWSKEIGVVYKCSAVLATQVRRNGWTVMRIATDARLSPQTFQTSGNKRQSLRRKLRKAATDGVVISEGLENLDRLEEIAMIWAKNHCGELGFSMGRFAPDYIAGQRVFLIRQDGVIKGFVTFHQSGTSWALDLIRYVPGLPDGAMQAAVVAAIETAKSEGATTFCLGAVPQFDVVLQKLAKSREGLAQFKRSFGPTWHPVYFAARNPFALVVYGFSITWAIQRPLHNLRYRVPIIKIMHAFQLCSARARGTGDETSLGHMPHDQCTQPAFDQPGLDSR